MRRVSRPEFGQISPEVGRRVGSVGMTPPARAQDRARISQHERRSFLLSSSEFDSGDGGHQAREKSPVWAEI